MRLTLRAMLAYIDGLLGPEDAEDIGKKIEENKTANEIYHRLRDVMRRVRLAAPSPTERGQWLDPNTVAEYLDNALPADRVPDFEKVCLESDMQLGEVGACHQILALVLGEPAEIDPASRERMYQLLRIAAQAQTESQAPKAPAAPEPVPAAAAPGDHKPRPKPTVPEYLREPKRGMRLLPIAALLVLAGCFVTLVMLAMGLFEPDQLVGGWIRRLLGREEVAAAPASPESSAEEGEEHPAKSSADEESKEPAAAPQEKKTVASGPAAAKTGAPSEPVEPQIVPPAEVVLEKPAVPDPGAKPPAILPPDRVAKAEPVLPPVPALNPPVVPQAKTPTEPQGKEKTPPGVEAKAAPEPAPKTVVPEPAPPQRVGKVISEAHEVLLRLDPDPAGWQRTPADDVVVTRRHLLALPASRPRIALTTGATLELVGGTRMELLPEDAQNPLGFDLRYGRVVLKPLAQPAARVRVTADQRTGILTLVETESVAALELSRAHQPGTSPEMEPAQVVADLYVARGEVLWDDGSGKKPLQISGPARLSLIPAGGAAIHLDDKELPKWIAPEAVGPLERGAMVTLSQALPATRSPVLGLMELAEHRRTEVRGLVVRCLGHVGQFEPVAAAMNDMARKAEWFDCVEELRLGIASGPETVLLVRQAMEKQYNQDGRALYRMLLGYTDQDLQNGDDARLVAMLDHKMLVFRVLAFWNLKEITGMKMYYYPDNPASKRQQSIARWQAWQQQGKIRTRTADEKARGPAETPSGKDKTEVPPGAAPKAPSPPPVRAVPPEPEPGTEP